jgi:monoamine oxidase
MNRRNFIKDATAVITAGSVLQQCTLVNNQTIKGKIVGANSTTGHLLRETQHLVSTNTITTGTVIIGGGISGLSAARLLWKNGHKDFKLLELDAEIGGNTASGKNDVSAYPWGAHYVPIPNNDLKEFLNFLEECQVITGYNETGLPLINEFYLCFEPQERLYINGHWQEGLVPDFGVPPDEQKQIKKFFAEMVNFRLAKGADGKAAFAIPADNSSSDAVYKMIDTITMKEWLLQNNYTSTYLHWYCNYCCRDDFGTDYSLASAWAGIHYFAGRKGVAANAPPQSVITWSEGNTWLANQLKKNIEVNILTNHLATSIAMNEQGVEVTVLDAQTKKLRTIIAKNCIVATPQFIAARLLKADTKRKQLVAENFVYQPWMVANITTKKLDERNGAGLSWDNVLYQSKALGYVEATHQHINQLQEKLVLTYYLPLTEKSAKLERELAQKRTFADWVNILLNDLTPAHNNLLASIENIDVWVWGHGMISPHKGFIHGEVKKQLQQPIDNKIFFAHTDLAGISIFEEAFYQGIKAAKQILET